MRFQTDKELYLFPRRYGSPAFSRDIEYIASEDLRGNSDLKYRLRLGGIDAPTDRHLGVVPAETEVELIDVIDEINRTTIGVYRARVFRFRGYSRDLDAEFEHTEHYSMDAYNPDRVVTYHPYDSLQDFEPEKHASRDKIYLQPDNGNP